MTQQPDQYTDTRKDRLQNWKRNRDHTNGIDAVKRATTEYLPQHSSMDVADYQAHLNATEYLPAAARTLESHIGLVFRKSPTLSAPDSAKALPEAFSADGQSLEQVARWAFREYLITNDGGLLIDYPETPDGLSLADALAQDLRPFGARYSAESIRQIRHGVRGGRKRLIHVTLSDDPETLRQLDLIDGEYQVTILKLIDGERWVEEAKYIPQVSGRSLDRIPFIHFTDENEGKAHFDDLCAKNVEHFIHAGRHDNILLWLGRPKPYVAGVETDFELDNSPNAIWRFESKEVKVGFLELTPNGTKPIVEHMANLKETMAQIGSRMLSSEKAAAEAAETIARRQASENSILASVARHVSAKLTDALKLMAEWMGIETQDIGYSLSTDFIPLAIDPQMVAQLVSLNQAGKLTDQELFDALQKGEIISEAITYEEHAATLDTGAE